MQTTEKKLIESWHPYHQESNAYRAALFDVAMSIDCKDASGWKIYRQVMDTLEVLTPDEC
jgi:hypothetical protein